MKAARLNGYEETNMVKMRRSLVISFSKHRADYGRAGWQYAHPDGSAVLKEDVNWRLISGFYVRTGKQYVWVSWRRRRLSR